MCTVAHGMGSGWEQHIARLINQAHETLSSSAYSRRHHLSGGAPSPYCGSVSSPYRGSSTPLRSTPSTFRGDRGASYRRGSEGWDESSFAKDPCGGGIGACPSPSMAPPPPPFSRLAGARVHDARIDGLEDRVKLEVQTVVRRDVDHRVSIAERAVEHLRHSVEELAEEVSSLGEVSRKCNATVKSHTGTLDQILAGEERSRSVLGLWEKWRAEREGWCARTDDSLASLSDNARALTRRAHTQQKALDEATLEQERLAASIKAARKAGDAAVASAVVPVREHFLKEIGTIRRRLLALEEEAAESAVPQVTKALVKATAEDVAAEKGEELRTAMEAHVRGKVARGAEEAAATAATANREIERRLAEVEQRLGTCDSALGTLKRFDRETSADVPGLQNDVSALQKQLADGLSGMSALQQQLADGLSRIDDSGETRLREARQAAVQQVLKLESDRMVATRDLDDRLKNLEELGRLGAKPPTTDVAPAVVAPSASIEKVEELADTVRELVSKADFAATRQENSENRMEELSEKLCAHSLKLSCLEGLWREPDGIFKDKKATEEIKGVDSDVMTAVSDASARRRPEPQTQQQQQQQRQVRVDAGEGYVPSLTTPIRSGLSGFLKRLGSTSTSSSQGEVGVKTGNKNGAEMGTRRQSSAAAAEPNNPPPPQGARKQSVGLEVAGGVLKAVSESPSVVQGRLVKDKKDVSRGDGLSDENIEKSEKPDNQALDTNARPIHRRQRSGDISQRSGDISSSVEHIDRAAHESTSSANSRSSRERTSPDEYAPLHEGRAEQTLSVGGDRQPSHGVGTTLLASDEEGPHTSGNAEGAPDAETEGVTKHERKDTQDAAMSPDTSIQSQREGNEIADGVSRVGTTADHSASEPLDAMPTAMEGKSAQEGGQIVRQATDLETSGSVEGSEHSRWSLPSAGGIGGLGGVREERAVWAGLLDAEDSMGSAEQAPSSGTGERGGDGKSSRSRVESYDLQQEEGDNYMVPFSPARDSVEDDQLNAASPGVTVSTPKEPGGGSRQTTSDDGKPGVVASSAATNTAADVEVDAAATTKIPPVAAISSPPELKDIGGCALSTVRSFCFSDDDDDDDGDFITEKAAKPERLSTPFNAATQQGDGLEGSDDGSVHGGGGGGGGGRRSGSDSSWDGTDAIESGGGDGEPHHTDDSSDSTHTGSDDGGERPAERQLAERRQSSGALPNAAGVDGAKLPEGDRSSLAEGEGLAPTSATPAAETWARPDFGFSSDDDLNLDLSSSAVSSSRQAEVKGEDEQTPPPSSSPLLQGSYDGFDSSSVAS